MFVLQRRGLEPRRCDVEPTLAKNARGGQPP